MLFLFGVVFNKTKNAALKLALAILVGYPVTVANDAIEMLPLVADKTIKDLSKYPKEDLDLLNIVLIISLSLISTI